MSTLMPLPGRHRLRRQWTRMALREFSRRMGMCPDAPHGRAEESGWLEEALLGHEAYVPVLERGEEHQNVEVALVVGHEGVGDWTGPARERSARTRTPARAQAPIMAHWRSTQCATRAFSPIPAVSQHSAGHQGWSEPGRTVKKSSSVQKSHRSMALGVFPRGRGS